MNIAELDKLLYDQNVPSRFYRTDGTDFELAECLVRRRDKWCIYLCERGGEYDKIEFSNENDACVHFVGRVFRSLIASGLVVVRDHE